MSNLTREEWDAKKKTIGWIIDQAQGKSDPAFLEASAKMMFGPRPPATPPAPVTISSEECEAVTISVTDLTNILYFYDVNGNQILIHKSKIDELFKAVQAIKDWNDQL